MKKLFLFPLLILLFSCAPELEEGKFSCDLNSSSSCPGGFTCLIKLDYSPEPRCFSESTDSYCGNEKIEAGEQCDPKEIDRDATDFTDDGSEYLNFSENRKPCRDMGFWGGESLCNQCVFNTDSCMSIWEVGIGANHMCVLTHMLEIYCWGGNSKDQLARDFDKESDFEPGKVISFIALEENGFESESVANEFGMLSVGANHNCAISVFDQQIYCWGDNQFGQVGQQYLVNYSFPTKVEIPNTEEEWFISIEAGNKSSCAITESNRLFCWGNINHLSDSTEFDDFKPREITGEGPPLEFLEVSISPFDAGHSSCTLEYDEIINRNDHACVSVLENNILKAFCFGNNEYGQLGDGSNTPSAPPTKLVEVNSNNEYIKVRAGALHSCGLNFNNKIECWGSNFSNILGVNNDSTEIISPEVIDSTHSFIDFDISRNGCGLVEIYERNGESEEDATSYIVSCWGPSYYTEETGFHFQDYYLSDFGWEGEETFWSSDNIMVSSNNVCTIDATGLPKCIYFEGEDAITGSFHVSLVPIPFGGVIEEFYLATMGIVFNMSGNTTYVGCLGNDLDCFPSDDAAEFIKNYDKLSFGEAFGCGLGYDGKIDCWGMNEMGQLGNTFIDPVEIVSNITPIFFEDGTPIFVDLISSSSHSCAITDGSEVWCWGSNEQFQSASIMEPISATPIRVTVDGTENPLGNIRQLGLGRDFSCALNHVNELFCWGQNSFNYSMGEPPFYENAKKIPNVPSFSMIDGGGGFLCGIDDNNMVWCWGNSGFLLIPTEKRFKKISVAMDYACGITNELDSENGKIYCWGNNGQGQLGIGIISNEITIPQKVIGTEEVSFRDLSCHTTYCCAVADDEQLFCWGSVPANREFEGEKFFAPIIEPFTEY
jgi:alpha-tubulin suppressor-like RCC1 family protein